MHSILGVPLGSKAVLFLALAGLVSQVTALPQEPAEVDSDSIDGQVAEDPGLDLTIPGHGDATLAARDDADPTVIKSPVLTVSVAAVQGTALPTHIVEDVKKNLPGALKQEGLSDADVKNLTNSQTDEILNALKAFFENGNGHTDEHGDLGKRDLEDRDADADAYAEAAALLEERGLWDEIKKHACKVFARFTRPAYLASAALFNILNKGPGSGIYHYQKFFLYPLHKKLFDNHINVRVYYHAHWVAKKFWSAVGVSFGKKIFLSRTYQGYSVANAYDFYSQVYLLAHELQHTEQYYNKHWSLWDFGYEYLYQYCRAGFKYTGIAYEVEARNAAIRIQNLLVNGRGFFLYWRARALYAKLGYPVDVNYHDVSHDRRELAFQKGKVQIKHTQNPPCHRYKAGTAAWSKWDCHAF